MLGPSRTGKGTLLCALLGHKIKMMKKKDVKNTDFYSEVTSNMFMACVDAQGKPLRNAIMSQSQNSHTLSPKIIGDVASYPKKFVEAGLNQMHLIDFPGMFDSKGPELEIAFTLSLQRILTSAKSAHILVLVPATSLGSATSKII